MFTQAASAGEVAKRAMARLREAFRVANAHTGPDLEQQSEGGITSSEDEEAEHMRSVRPRRSAMFRAVGAATARNSAYRLRDEHTGAAGGGRALAASANVATADFHQRAPPPHGGGGVPRWAMHAGGARGLGASAGSGAPTEQLHFRRCKHNACVESAHEHQLLQM